MVGHTFHCNSEREGAAGAEAEKTENKQ